jgi:hypothetical protein
LRGCFRLDFSTGAGVCRYVPSCQWEPCGDGPERGLVGFLWGRPEAFGGSPSPSFRDFRPWLIEADSRLGHGGRQPGLPSGPVAHPGAAG